MKNEHGQTGKMWSWPKREAEMEDAWWEALQEDFSRLRPRMVIMYHFRSGKTYASITATRGLAIKVRDAYAVVTNLDSKQEETLTRGAQFFVEPCCMGCYREISARDLPHSGLLICKGCHARILKTGLCGICESGACRQEIGGLL